MATRFLRWIWNGLRYALTLLLAAACSYALDRWFFSGLVASKWIGLPQYETAMKELQHQSLHWGITALILGILALALVLPRWPGRAEAKTIHPPLAASAGGNVWMEYLGRCLFRAGIIVLAAFGLAILIPLTANLSMKTIPRIVIAFLASFLFNALLLVVLSLDDRKGDSSWFRRFIEFIAEPPTFVANAFFQSLPPVKMALAWTAVSIVYFAVIIWIGIALFSLF